MPECLVYSYITQIFVNGTLPSCWLNSFRDAQSAVLMSLARWWVLTLQVDVTCKQILHVSRGITCWLNRFGDMECFCQNLYSLIYLLGPSKFLISDFLKTCAPWTLTYPEHRRVSQSSLASRCESLTMDKCHSVQSSSVQSLSPVQLFVTPWTGTCQAPCQSPTPKVHPNSCPLSHWCHPIISSSVVPFSSCPQSFPASGCFSVSQLFASGGQSIAVLASTSVLPVNTQDWSPLGWTGWISLQSKGLSRVFSNTIVQKHQFFGTQLSLQSNSHIHTWPLEKP